MNEQAPNPSERDGFAPDLDQILEANKHGHEELQAERERAAAAEADRIAKAQAKHGAELLDVAIGPFSSDNPETHKQLNEEATAVKSLKNYLAKRPRNQKEAEALNAKYEARITDAYVNPASNGKKIEDKHNVELIRDYGDAVAVSDRTRAFDVIDEFQRRAEGEKTPADKAAYMEHFGKRMKKFHKDEDKPESASQESAALTVKVSNTEASKASSESALPRRAPRKDRPAGFDPVGSKTESTTPNTKTTAKKQREADARKEVEEARAPAGESQNSPLQSRIDQARADGLKTEREPQDNSIKGRVGRARAKTEAEAGLTPDELLDKFLHEELTDDEAEYLSVIQGYIDANYGPGKQLDTEQFWTQVKGALQKDKDEVELARFRDKYLDYLELVAGVGAWTPSEETSHGIPKYYTMIEEGSKPEETHSDDDASTGGESEPAEESAEHPTEESEEAEGAETPGSEETEKASGKLAGLKNKAGKVKKFLKSKTNKKAEGAFGPQMRTAEEIKELTAPLRTLSTAEQKALDTENAAMRNGPIRMPRQKLSRVERNKRREAREQRIANTKAAIARNSQYGVPMSAEKLDEMMDNDNATDLKVATSKNSKPGQSIKKTARKAVNAAKARTAKLWQEQARKRQERNQHDGFDVFTNPRV